MVNIPLWMTSETIKPILGGDGDFMVEPNQWLLAPVPDKHSNHSTISPTATAAGSTSAPNVYYDAGLVLHFGFNPPVGIVRVEHYVAEALAKNPHINLRFVIFDQRISAYRHLDSEEQKRINDILFRRYEVRRYEVPKAPPAEPHHRGVLDKLATASRISAEQFDQILSKDLKRIMPISSEHSIVRRVLTSLFRRSVFEAGRAGQRILLSVGKGMQQLGRIYAQAAQVSAPPSCAFVSGDVLLILANSWDYMDYTYLTRIVKGDGVRLISVIYDVIQIEMPYTSPSAPHIFHRHCVELGHLASHLIAISKHSMESYRRFVAEPNEVDPAITWATLPSFLYDRREEIGETTVQHLFNRRFVVYCSTIETRKNHQILLHTWDRLRQQISPDKLPILVFVGKWGWGTECVRLLSQHNWRLREHLRILNETSDAELIWLYRHARFTVFPALAEGFGLAAAESLSFGTPVIVGDCPALIEATEGLMPAYDPLDLPGWLAEMRRLALDDDYVLGLRKRAAQFRGVRYDDFADAVLNTILTENDMNASSIVRERIECAAA